jgi:predicted dehydrogenase
MMRVAQIGCGGIGHRRAEAIASIPELELLLCVDSIRERAWSAAERWGCEASTQWEDAVGRSDVDVVIVSTPNVFHAPISIAALEAGQHVVCEKPLARNPEEAHRMVEAAKASGCQLRTGFNHRFHAQVTKARTLIEEGAVGEPMFLRGRTGHGGGQRMLNSWFWDERMAGGGTFLDNGVHALDLARLLMGEFVEATGFRTTILWDIAPLEDNGFGLFRTADGRVASLHSSWTQWKGYLYLEVFGTEGFVIIDYDPAQTTLVRRKTPDKTELYEFPVQPNTWARELEELLKAIAGDTAQSATGYDGQRAVEMAYAVYDSSRQGRTVRF